MLVFLALAPILWVTHGSIPERALNDMTSLAAFGLLTMVFLLGLSNAALGRVILPVKYLSTLPLIARSPRAKKQAVRASRGHLAAGAGPLDSSRPPPPRLGIIRPQAERLLETRYRLRRAPKSA